LAGKTGAGPVPLEQASQLAYLGARIGAGRPAARWPPRSVRVQSRVLPAVSSCPRSLTSNRVPAGENQPWLARSLGEESGVPLCFR